MKIELTALVERLASHDWREVAHVERELLAMGEEGMQAIIAGMTHPRPRVRCRCAGIMDHHGDDRCVPNLVDCLVTDTVPNVRREAVHSLGCDRCKASPLQVDCVPLLLEVLHTDSNIKVRREAAYGLSQKAPDARVMAELRRLLIEETDRHIRNSAHGALYHYDSEYRADCIAEAKQRQWERNMKADRVSPSAGT